MTGNVSDLIAEARAAEPCGWCDQISTGFAYQTDEHTYPERSCGQAGHGYDYYAASLVSADLHLRLADALEQSQPGEVATVEQIAQILHAHSRHHAVEEDICNACSGQPFIGKVDIVTHLANVIVALTSPQNGEER